MIRYNIILYKVYILKTIQQLETHCFKYLFKKLNQLENPLLFRQRCQFIGHIWLTPIQLIIIHVYFLWPQYFIDHLTSVHRCRSRYCHHEVFSFDFYYNIQHGFASNTKFVTVSGWLSDYSVSASRTVDREFASRSGHTKDHHKNGTNCLPAWHTMH